VHKANEENPTAEIKRKERGPGEICSPERKRRVSGRPLPEKRKSN